MFASSVLHLALLEMRRIDERSRSYTDKADALYLNFVVRLSLYEYAVPK